MKYIKRFEQLQTTLNVKDIEECLQYFIDEFDLKLKYYSLSDGLLIKPEDALTQAYYIRYDNSNSGTSVNIEYLYNQLRRALIKLDTLGYAVGLIVSFEKNEKYYKEARNMESLRNIVEYCKSDNCEVLEVEDMTITVSIK